MFPGKPKRLPHNSYKGERLYFLTILTQSRRRVFLDPELVTLCAAQFARAAQATQFEIVAYCYMPDHLHVLVRGTSGTSDLITFVKRAKQLSGYHGKRITGHTLWRERYHERIVRHDEDPQRYVNYIRMNPVKAGLVQRPEEYAFTRAVVPGAAAPALSSPTPPSLTPPSPAPPSLAPPSPAPPDL